MYPLRQSAKEVTSDVVQRARKKSLWGNEGRKEERKEGRKGRGGGAEVRRMNSPERDIAEAADGGRRTAKTFARFSPLHPNTEEGRKEQQTERRERHALK